MKVIKYKSDVHSVFCNEFNEWKRTYLSIQTK